ncbi:MAG TPA: hypothetical protein VMT35_19225 [Ignavibacteriaceae bacterium]|nr:hypothetical protein [Ignavibacteriaceae bacterium]
MKAFLTLFTGLLLIIPAHNVNAQASRLPIPDKDRFYSINESQSDQYLLNGRERLSHVLSMGKVMAGQRIAGTLSKRQAQSFEGLGKTNDQVYLPDSLTLFSMSDTICMSASYDQRGWITQILVQVLSGGHWVNYSRTTWTYLDQNASNLTLE